MRSLHNVSYDGVFEMLLIFRDRLMRSLFLLGWVVEDYGTVLRAYVIALSVHSGWVVKFPEPFKQIGKWQYWWVEIYLNNLHMAGRAITDLIVSRILNMSTHIPACYGVDTWDL